MGITSLAHFISLKLKPEDWAEKILSEGVIKRKNMGDEIVGAGYDIKHEIGELEAFYKYGNRVFI